MIGTGMYVEKDSGYRTTKYEFRDGNTFETHLFLEALLQNNLGQNIDKIIIVGTITSDWGALIANYNEYTELSLKLLENKKIISKETFSELEATLSKMYKKDVQIFYHTDEIDSETTEEIFNVYKEISKSIPQGSKILFDITHGFRSMPILLYQTLQYAFQNEFSDSLSIIYGEYIPTEKISKVRDLSGYLEYAEIASGFKLFNERFDGRILAEKSKDIWGKGSKWLKKFTEIVQTNYFLQIFTSQKELANILKEDLPEKAPSWLIDLYDLLKAFYNKLKKLEKSKLLFEFSKILAEKKLYTQAIIALQVSVEAKGVEMFGDWDKLGDYDYYKQTVRTAFKDFLKNEFEQKHGQKAKVRIYELEGVRNQVAHGGAKNKKTGGDPQAENIVNQYDSFVQIVEKLLEYEV
jgi:CRISPR-associated Csx2 family protein